MAWNQNDISFKTLLNKRQTDSNKQFYEEFGDNTINVHLDEIWVNDIPKDPSHGPSSSYPYIQFFDKWTLIVDPQVGGNLTWFAVTDPSLTYTQDVNTGDDLTNLRLKDWISDKYGAGYDIKLFSNGTELSKTSAVYPWRFDYMTGNLTFNAVPPTPIQITGYRYNGVKGIVAPTDSSGTLSQTFQLYMTNDGVKLKDSSGNLEIRNSTDSYYTGITANSFNAGTADSLYLLNLKEDAVESMLNSYYVFDASPSIFNGVYSTPPISGPAVVNDASVYSNASGSISLYKSGTNWFLQQIDSSSLSPTQTQTWSGPFWFNEGNIIGAYFGNSTYFRSNLTIYNYQSLYPEIVGRFRRAIGVQGSVDVLGNLGVHGKIVAEQLKLDPSFNGVLITTKGEVSVSAYPKSKSFSATIVGPGNSFTIDHSLGTYNQMIAVYDPSTQEELYPEKIRGENTSTLNFTNVDPGVMYDIVIIGY